MQKDILAVDFGTSNSAAAIFDGTQIVPIPLEEKQETIPTAVFFPLDGKPMQIGATATQSLIGGDEGRYMRALKSVLGQPLLHEPRMIGGKRQTLADIITLFLTQVRARATAQTGVNFTHVLSGRPVHFHTNDLKRDAQAELDLRSCYEAAGFEDVQFLVEPEAAAIASHSIGGHHEIGLIVDIGGGTSDFSVFRHEDGQPDILANYGVRLGGTDFDQSVSLDFAMPVLGLGGQMRRDMGEGLLPIPRGPYVDLSTWSRIPFLYNAKTKSLIEGIEKLAIDPEALERFGSVLELELGHELAFAVEKGKIAANQSRSMGQIEMGYIQKGLSESISYDGLNATLAGNRFELRKAAEETLHRAGLKAEDIGCVIFVGGSSMMHFVTEEIGALCPQAEQLFSKAFTAVVDGLALATARHS